MRDLVFNPEADSPPLLITPAQSRKESATVSIAVTMSAEESSGCASAWQCSHLTHANAQGDMRIAMGAA
ncbi:hypothetical protein D3C72_1879170 [compost metagenome]